MSNWRSGVERRERRIELESAAHRGIEHFDAHARGLVCEHAGARVGRQGPVGRNHKLRLRFDQRFGFPLQGAEMLLRDEAFALESRSVCGNRILRRPERMKLPVRVALIRQRRIRPGRLGLFSEIQHVVVMRVTAHAHRYELDQRRPVPRTRPLDRPRERGCNLVGIGAVDRHARDPVTNRLVREHADR